MNDTAASPDFALEPAPNWSGEIPDRVIQELRNARIIAKDHAQSYADAIAAQAQKYGVKPSALKRYVNALVSDKLEDAAAECKDLERLIG